MNSQELLQLYQDGQSEAATAIFDRYVARLIALARSRIGPKLRRRVDPEDIVQSAYRSFFVHAKDDAYQLAQSGDLWRLLASITLNKLYSQVEKQTAAKRNVDREEPGEFFADNEKAPDPSAAEVVAIIEELHLVINSLSPDEQLALTSRLQGKSIEEIGRLLDKSDRTVRRLLADAKGKIEQRLLADEPFVPKAQHSVSKLQAPLKYSDYILEQLLGSGGMGKVYRATEKKTGKIVAVKALHKSRQSDVRAVSQFVQEAQILAKLRHPNIVGVQGLGQFPGSGFFIVMDFVDGVDLQTRLDTGPLPLNETISIVKVVAQAVGHAHENGIVHCDLKPGNVLLDKNGQVSVTDFGFAFLVTDSPATTANSVGGTVGYMAPEILSLQSQPTPTADIYALGVLLWTLSTGELPKDSCFHGKDKEALVPMARIVRTCLAVDPSHRYQSTDELHKELDDLQ